MEITKQNYRSFNGKKVSYTIENGTVITGVLHISPYYCFSIFNNSRGNPKTPYFKKLYKEWRFELYLGYLDLHGCRTIFNKITFLDDNNTDWWFIN